MRQTRSPAFTSQKISGLVSQWKFDNLGMVVTDRGGAGNNATVDTSGVVKVSGGYSFTGSGAINCGLSPSLNVFSGDFTIRAKFSTITSSPTMAIMGKLLYGGTFAYSWGLEKLTTSQKIRMLVRGSGDGSLSSNDNIVSGTVYDVAVIRSSGSISMCVNGVMQSSVATRNSGMEFRDANPFYLGRRSTAAENYFVGNYYLGEVYNRALTSGEVTSLTAV